MVPASQNAMGPLYRVCPALLHVCYLHRVRGGGVSLMSYAHDSTVQADARRVGRLVKLLIANLRSDNVVCGLAGYSLGYQGTHQESRDRRVSVREMKEIFFGFLVGDGVAAHPWARARREFEPLEAGHIQAPRILGRDSVNADTVKRFLLRVQQGHHLTVDFDQIR